MTDYCNKETDAVESVFSGLFYCKAKKPGTLCIVIKDFLRFIWLKY